MPEATPREVIEAVEALKVQVLGLSKHAPTEDEKRRLDERLNKFDEQFQKAFLDAKRVEGLEQEIEAKKAEIEALDTKHSKTADRLIELEAMIAQRDPSNTKGKNYRDLAEVKAIESWLRRPDAVPEELKAELRTDVDTAGGFMVPTVLDSELQKEIVEMDPLRSVARVRTIAAKTMDMVVRTSIPVATFEGETEAGEDSIASYRLVSVTPYRQTVTIPVTLDQLMNSQFNMDTEILQDAGESFAYYEGNGFVNGTGVKQPEGFLNNPTIIAGLSSADMTDDTAWSNAIIDAQGKLKRGYNGTWAFHRTTLARLRRLRATATGELLWGMFQDGPAPTLLGSPYIILPSMDPHPTNQGDLIVYADFRRGYQIVDRAALTVVRDEFAKKRQAIIEVTLHRYVTGIVTMPEAFHLLRDN